MIAVIVATHGEFARELVKSSEMIFGKQDNIGVVTFKTGEGVDDLLDKYKKLIKELDTKEGLLFMVDLFGGSPFNAASRIVAENDNMDILAGVSLPMLLEVCGYREFSKLEEVVDAGQRAAVEGVKSFKSIINTNKEEDL